MITLIAIATWRPWVRSTLSPEVRRGYPPRLRRAPSALLARPRDPSYASPPEPLPLSYDSRARGAPSVSGVGRRLRRDADLRQAGLRRRARPSPRLLALRFAMAAAMLWALIALRRRPLGSLRGLAAGAALGLVGYAAQAGLYFGALERIDAGPRLAAALRLPRVRHASPPSRCAASRPPAASSARSRSPRAASRSCSPAAAPARSTRSAPPWRSARRLLHRLHPRAPTARRPTSPPCRSRRASPPAPRSPSRSRRCSSGGITRRGEGVMWAAVIASVSTVMPIVLFMAGLARVGPSTARRSPRRSSRRFTVALAWLVFGETLGPLQLAGGALVLSAVVLLQLRRGVPRCSDGVRRLGPLAGARGSRGAGRRADRRAGRRPRAEPGCLTWLPHRSIAEPRLFWLYEAVRRRGRVRDAPGDRALHPAGEGRGDPGAARVARARVLDL